MSGSAWDEPIEAYLSQRASNPKEEERYVLLQKVLEIGVGIPSKDITKKSQDEARRVMVGLGWIAGKKKLDGETKRAYWAPGTSQAKKELEGKAVEKSTTDKRIQDAAREDATDGITKAQFDGFDASTGRGSLRAPEAA